MLNVKEKESENTCVFNYGTKKTFNQSWILWDFWEQQWQKKISSQKGSGD